MVARAHKTLIWERTRHMLRLRHALREYFPAALEAFDDLDAADTLELLGKAPDPASAAKLNRSQIRAALKHARRRDLDTKTIRIQAALRGEQLGRDAVITGAYAATTRSIVAVLATLNEQITTLRRAGRGSILAGTRTLRSSCPSPAWDRARRPGARRIRRRPRTLRRRQGAQELRRHQPDHPRVGQEEGRARPVRAQRPARRRAHVQAQSALRASPGARAYYDKQRARGLDHNAALRQLANRLVGILHGCLKTRTLYDEARAWPTTTKINKMLLDNQAHGMSQGSLRDRCATDLRPALDPGASTAPHRAAARADARRCPSGRAALNRKITTNQSLRF